MKKLFLLLPVMAMSCLAHAGHPPVANDSTIRLKEVEIKAARIVSQADGMLYIPSGQQKESSSNGYSLLGKLSMPMIRVNEVKHTVGSVDNKGVQVRLNGTLATMADLLSLDPKLVRNVEFVNNPGVRYGDGIGYVVNIRTRRADGGLAIGADLTNAVASRYGSDMVYARWNRKNAEWGLAYNFGYNDSRHARYSENADYLLTDGSYHHIGRQDSARRDRSFSNNIQLKYNLADSASYVFQAALTGDFSHSPGDWDYRRFMEAGVGEAMTVRLGHGKSFSPVLDLYFHHALGSHQSVTANIVGTSISTDQYQCNNEGTEYAYHVDGNTWSLSSEAIYENRLRPFTMSFGVSHLWKYTRNIYSGDAKSTNNMHNSHLYLFGQMKGSLWPGLDYSAGLGVSNVNYRQGDNDLDYWLFRPKATFSYRLQPFSFSCSFEVAQHISQIAMVSDTRIRTNSLEWTVGNPNLKPTDRITQEFSIAFSKPRIYSQIYGEYRVNRKCNMANYERTADNQFLYMQKNQPHVNMFFVLNYTRWTILPEKLTASFEGGIYRFFNKGDDYNHCLTSCLVSGSLQASLGRWTLAGQVDNGWKFMEGETQSHQGFGNALRCSYRMAGCQLSLTWYHPFEAHPRTAHARLLNRYLHKEMQLRSGDDGNSIFLNFSWKLNRGRKYKDIDRDMRNKDTQTGIL